MSMISVSRRHMLSKSLIKCVPFLSIFIHAAVLLGYHVHADNNSTIVSDDGFLERLKNGPDALNPTDYLLFGAFILLAFEALNNIVMMSGKTFNASLIPVRGKHLDDLSQKDLTFIGFNKIAVVPFMYFCIRYTYNEKNVLWDINSLSFKNVFLPMPLLYIIYDFFYTILHWALHIKSIYGYIHKHHHTQKAPSRANVDAVNVHPIEFFLGEYNHLFTIFLYCKLGLQMHVACFLIFMAVDAFLTGYNHTRYDVVISLFGLKLYDSKAHDVHHRIPQSNYGQYTMFWDHIFGSFRAYNENDRVNPLAQLDPKTGKSLEYMKNKKNS